MISSVTRSSCLASMMRGTRATSTRAGKMSHSLTRGDEVNCKPVSAWLGEYFLFWLFARRVIFGSGIKCDTPFSHRFYDCMLEALASISYAWRVIEPVVPAYRLA